MHDPSQASSSTAAQSTAAAPEYNGSSARPARVSTDLSPGSKGQQQPPIVESPQGPHPAQGTAYSTEYGAHHLSGHEARAFPGVYTMGGNRSGSVRKDDSTPSSNETVESNGA